MGERTPLALLDAAASGRMAVCEAVTNIAAADIARIEDIRLSANWMAACGEPGEDADLYDTVRAVGEELCPELGIAIPVGKDSLSMKTAWQQGDEDRKVVAPVSLIVSAFAPVVDVRRTLTPQLRLDCGDTRLVLVDLGGGRQSARRFLPRAGLRTRRTGTARLRRRAAGAGLLCGHCAAARRRTGARLPRSLRRRAVRHAGRNGLRRALWPRSRSSTRAGRAPPWRPCSPRNSVRSCRFARKTKQRVLAALREAGLGAFCPRHRARGRPRTGSRSGTRRAQCWSHRAASCAGPGRRRAT